MPSNIFKTSIISGIFCFLSCGNAFADGTESSDLDNRYKIEGAPYTSGDVSDRELSNKIVVRQCFNENKKI